MKKENGSVGYRNLAKIMIWYPWLVSGNGYFLIKIVNRNDEFLGLGAWKRNIDLLAAFFLTEKYPLRLGAQRFFLQEAAILFAGKRISILGAERFFCRKEFV